MGHHLQRQIDKLKKMILSLGGMVEEVVQLAIRAIDTRDVDLAQKVIDQDARIDLMEIDVEEECLHTLALHQPVAFDLRYIIAVLKINNDLERIADLAVNVAEQAQYLAQRRDVDATIFDLPSMQRTVQIMLKNSLDALVRIDVELAKSVWRTDDEVDAIHRKMYEQVQERIINDPDQIEPMIHLLGVSRQLERIADHCVNIAQDVLYTAEGRVVRHEAQPPQKQSTRG